MKKKKVPSPGNVTLAKMKISKNTQIRIVFVLILICIAIAIRLNQDKPEIKNDTYNSKYNNAEKNKTRKEE